MILILAYVFPFSFTKAGLDAQAPKKGEEYIFNGRPSKQPTITQERLNKWYMNLLGEAADQHVVDDVKYDKNIDSSVSFYFESSCHISL